MNESITSGVALVNGAEIHYDMAGAGFPLVLLHAGVCDRRMWDEQLPALAEHFRVLRYDQRGFGETRMPLGPFSHLADLEGLLAALAIERAHLLGSSKGGQCALDFTLAHPERVGGLVLVCSGPSGYQPPQPVPEFDAVAGGDRGLRGWRPGASGRAGGAGVGGWRGPRRGPGEPGRAGAGAGDGSAGHAH